jgi:type VI secretion system FHA domain protein
MAGGSVCSATMPDDMSSGVTGASAGAAAIDQARRSDDPLGGSFLDEAPTEEDPDWGKVSQNDNVDTIPQALEAPRQPPLQPQTPDFAAEPTPVPENLDSGSGAPAFAAPEVPAVEDADALDALLGLDSSPAAEQPVVDGSAFDMPAAPADAPVTPDDMSSGIVAEHTEPPAMPEQDVIPESVMAPKETPREPEPTPTPPPVQTKAPAATGSSDDVASTLAQLLELGNLDQNQLDALTPEVVSVLQVTISHLLELLRARSSIKNELRLDRTMIQPVENNPLKFALTEKDALRYLFGEHSGAYMSGSKAVKEAFNDVSGHQMALLAGMRSAYEKMLGKFSPEALEARFGEAATKGLLSSKKARLWDAYVEYFDKLQQDPETSFNRLFGEEFASAYETQVDDIKLSKPDR